jgi:hypothetical protein
MYRNKGALRFWFVCSSHSCIESFGELGMHVCGGIYPEIMAAYERNMGEKIGVRLANVGVYMYVCMCALMQRLLMAACMCLHVFAVMGRT